MDKVTYLHIFIFRANMSMQILCLKFPHLDFHSTARRPESMILDFLRRQDRKKANELKEKKHMAKNTEYCRWLVITNLSFWWKSFGTVNIFFKFASERVDTHFSGGRSNQDLCAMYPICAMSLSFPRLSHSFGGVFFFQIRCR